MDSKRHHKPLSDPLERVLALLHHKAGTPTPSDDGIREQCVRGMLTHEALPPFDGSCSAPLEPYPSNNRPPDRHIVKRKLKTGCPQPIWLSEIVKMDALCMHCVCTV